MPTNPKTPYNSEDVKAATSMTKEEHLAHLKKNHPKFFENHKRLLITLGLAATAVATVFVLRTKDVEIPVVDDVIESITD